ncbi:MAG: metallophosphoesterase family protein [Bacilli bacterium]|nr:metallophosphoesterase family protein [Bacilli bacterium]
MNDKIAIISDIHGNLEATKAVLNNIKARGIDKIICLGDIIAKGTHSNACVDLVKKHCFMVLRGNTERYFMADVTLNGTTEIRKQRILWNQGLLTKENKEYLKNLPFSYEFYMSGSLVRMFHASPLKDDIVTISLDSVDKKIELFKPSDKTMSNQMADVVLYGHIHQQYLDKLYNKTLINVGSVGSTSNVIRDDALDSDKKETTQAHYLIIEGKLNEKEYNTDLNFQFVRVPYDIEKELEDVDKNFEPDMYKFEITEGMYRNLDRIREFYKEKGIILKK